MRFRLHQLLFLLPPEMAHRFAFLILRGLQFVVARFSSKKTTHSPSLHFKSAQSIAFKNRVGLAAGLDKNAEAFFILSKMGFGFIEVGTVTPIAQIGNPKPRVWRVESEGLINQMGFNNCGLERFRSNIAKLKPYCQVPIFANLGKNKDTPNDNAIGDYEKLIKRLNPCVDGFVINISSPNTPGLRALQSTEFLTQLDTVLNTKPAFLKLAPDLTQKELIEICHFVRESHKFNGLVLANTSRQIAQDVYQRDAGGYSGPQLFERAVEIVSIAREILKDDKLIIGSGGINNLERAQKMRKAGADLVEVYTGFIYQGPSFIRKLCLDLS